MSVKLVGISFRIPGASNFKELAVIMDTAERERRKTMTTRIGQFGTIDVDFFKTSPKEACQISPLLGTLFEVVTESIMDSGIPLRDVTSRKTGLYLQSNVPDTYMELTCNLAHNFNFKGPVVDFGVLDPCRTNHLDTAILDLSTGRCELAVVTGISYQGPPQPNPGQHIHGINGAAVQLPVQEGVVALLLMSPLLWSKLMTRVYCEILPIESLETADHNTPDTGSSDTSARADHNTPDTGSSDTSGRADHNTPDTGSSDTSARADHNTPDTGSSDTSARADHNTPDTGSSDTSARADHNTPEIRSTEMTATSDHKTPVIRSSDTSAMADHKTPDIGSSDVTTRADHSAPDIGSSDTTAQDDQITTLVGSLEITAKADHNKSEIRSSEMTAKTDHNRPGIGSLEMTAGDDHSKQEIRSSQITEKADQKTADITSSEITARPDHSTPDIKSPDITARDDQNTPFIESSEMTTRADYNKSEIRSSKRTTKTDHNTPDIESSEMTAKVDHSTPNIESSDDTARADHNTPLTGSPEMTAKADYNTLDTGSSETTANTDHNTPAIGSLEMTVKADHNTPDIRSSEMIARADHNKPDIEISEMRTGDNYVIEPIKSPETTAGTDNTPFIGSLESRGQADHNTPVNEENVKTLKHKTPLEHRMHPNSGQICKRFRGAESISALMEIIIVLSSKLSRDTVTKDAIAESGDAIDNNDKQEEYTTSISKDHVNGVVPSNGRSTGNGNGLMIKVTKRVSKVETDGEAYKSAVIPITIHNLLDVSEAQESLQIHENEPGFLPYLANTELSRGLKGQSQQKYYYFKIPDGSYFSRQDYTSYGELPVSIVFDDFLMSPWQPSSDLLNVDVFKNSISKFDEILRGETRSSYSVLDMISSSNVPDTDKQGGITTRIACQMAVVDLLEAVNSMEDINSIKASGLGSVAALYADGALTKTNAIKIAVVIENAMLDALKKEEEKFMVDIFCPFDDVYQLGPWVQVLCFLPRAGFRIAVPWEKREDMMNQIKREGFQYHEYFLRVPVYSSIFRGYLGRLDSALSDVIPTRVLWSDKLDILGFNRKEPSQRECTPSFFADLLCTPFDSKSKMDHTFGLSPCNEQMTMASTIESSESICEIAEEGEEYSETPNSASFVEKFELLSPLSETDATNSESVSRASGGEVKEPQTEVQRTEDNVSQEDDNGTAVFDIATRTILLPLPCKDLDIVNCSTRAVRGSFLYSTSLPTESVSSMSDLPSEKPSEDSSKSQSSENSSKSQSSENSSNSQSSEAPGQRNETVLNDRTSCEEPEDRKSVVNSEFQLHFFNTVDESILTGREILEDSSIQSNVSSSGSTPVYNDVHMLIKPGHVSLLESLAWIHGTGNRMEAAHQFRGPVADARYQGDFDIHNLWSWNRQPCCRIHSKLSPQFDTKEDMTIHSLSPKPLLAEGVLHDLITNRNLEYPSQQSASWCSDSPEILVCPFDASLLLLSGYKWDPYSNGVLPIYPVDSFDDAAKTLKQVRFSYRDSNFLCVDSPDGGGTSEELRQMTSSRHKMALADDLQFGFADRGDLLGILNLIRNEDFNFVSLLQIDAFIEKYLMDMLYTFPLTSALHVFITPKLRATSTSKYVINISRKVSLLAEEVIVILRDRLTDQTEICSSVTNALSIISSFEEDIYNRHLARVFELPMFLDDGAFSAMHRESLIFSKEMAVSREVFCEDDDKDDEHASSTTSSSSTDLEQYIDPPLNDSVDCNGNFESKSDADEKTSKSSTNQERPSRERNSSPTHMMTNFNLNFEASIVESLIKLSKINEHTLVFIQPKQDYLISEAVLNLIEDELDLCDEIRETDVPQRDKESGLAYMISVKSDSPSRIYLYSKKSQDISRWDCIKDVIDELKKRHPKLGITHEVRVLKCDERVVSFEELLHSFYHDQTCKVREKSDQERQIEEDLRSACEPLDDEEESNNSSKTYGGRQVEALKTPYMFSKGVIIPQIVISPPDQSSSTVNSPGAIAFVHRQIKCSEDGTNDPFTDSSHSKIDKQNHLYIENENKEEFVYLNEPRLSNKTTQTYNSVTNGMKNNNGALGEQTVNTPGSSARVTKVEAIEPSKLQDIAPVMELSEESFSNTPSRPINSEKTSGARKLEVEDKENRQNMQTRPENDSDKENTLLNSGPKIIYDHRHLRLPKFENLEHMTHFRVTAVLVVHLIDKISSVHEQKGRAAGNMLLYVARDISITVQSGRRAVLGIVLYDDMDVLHSRFDIPYSIEEERLETTLNYMLGWYIVHVLARVDMHKAERMNMIVQPPIQRDSAAILSVADYFGCLRIVTSSTLEDLRDDLHAMVPRCTVLKGDISRTSVLPLVGRSGADVVIMLRQHELSEMLDLLAPSGCLILCGEVDRTNEVNVRSIGNNGQITLFDALSAARYLATMGLKDREDFRHDLYWLLCSQDSQLDDCFPPSKESYFYQVLGRVYAPKAEEQPSESLLHEMFFSITQTLRGLLESISLDEWKMLGTVFEYMSKNPGDDCYQGKS